MDDALADLEAMLEDGFRRDAAAAGCTEATARVLLALGPDPVPMGELARRLHRDASTTTRFVDRASREGLVSRERGADRRRRLVRPTAAGGEMRRVLQERRRRWVERLPDAVRSRTGLGAGEVEWFLAAVVEAVRSLAPGPVQEPPPPPAR